MAYRGGRGPGEEEQHAVYDGLGAAPMGGGRAHPTGSPPCPCTSRPVYHDLAVTAGPHGIVYVTPAPAPSSSPATIRVPSPVPPPAAAPFQPAWVSPPPPTTSMAMELEQKLETTLSPSAPIAVSQVVQTESKKAPVSRRGVAHPVRPGAVNGGDNNVFQYDVRLTDLYLTPYHVYLLSVS